ncbi:MAG TPA: hypothetical protein VG101_12065 [Puia sp.]|jgi:hypothetical protein|nr:hypothetical protein [Puia sp.]
MVELFDGEGERGEGANPTVSAFHANFVEGDLVAGSKMTDEGNGFGCQAGTLISRNFLPIRDLVGDEVQFEVDCHAMQVLVSGNKYDYTPVGDHFRDGGGPRRNISQASFLVSQIYRVKCLFDSVISMMFSSLSKKKAES